MRENGFRAIGGLAQRLTSGIARRQRRLALRATACRMVGHRRSRTCPHHAARRAAGRPRRPDSAAPARCCGCSVSGAAALEVQHQTGQIVERVNAYFGHRMIDDIRLVQGVIAAPRPAPRVARARSAPWSRSWPSGPPREGPRSAGGAGAARRTHRYGPARLPAGQPRCPRRAGPRRSGAGAAAVPRPASRRSRARQGRRAQRR